MRLWLAKKREIYHCAFLGSLSTSSQLVGGAHVGQRRRLSFIARIPRTLLSSYTAAGLISIYTDGLINYWNCTGQRRPLVPAQKPNDGIVRHVQTLPFVLTNEYSDRIEKHPFTNTVNDIGGFGRKIFLPIIHVWFLTNIRIFCRVRLSTNRLDNRGGLIN